MRLISRIIITIILTQTALNAIGTQFLSIPTTTYELIFGVNPISQNAIYSPVLSASYGNWLGEIKVSSFGYHRNMFGGTTGINLRYVALNDLELRLDRPTAEPLSVFNANAIAVDGSYLRQLKIGLLGTKIRYISIQLFNETANGFAIDLSLNRQINDKLKVGIALLNFGNMSELYEEKPKLPIRTVIGSSYKFHFNNIDNSLFVAIEKSSIVNGVIFRIGNVASLNKIQILVGSQFSQKTVAVSGGIGIKLGAYRVGYGIQFGTQSLGIPQLFDISVTLP